MSIKKIFVFIYLPGKVEAVPAGRFDFDAEAEIGTFAYGRQYQLRENAVPVDPIELPLGKGTYKAAQRCAGLYGAFRDAMPDWWGRLVIARMLKKPSEDISEVDYLLYSNASRTGNLDFRDSLEAPEPQMRPPSFAELENLYKIAQAIETDTYLSPEEEALVPHLAQGTSMGGARPKCTVSWNNELWLAKFPAVGDRWSNAYVEYASMRLAEQCGIGVPAMVVKQIGGKDVLLLKRFDREMSKQGMVRHGYISALTVLGIDEREREKYSYPGLADAMRRHGFATSQDLEELYRRMIFNILARNTDDHPRNHGFLHKNGVWRLSPAFDITPTEARPGIGSEFHLAMSVGNYGREASLENALSMPERFGLTPEIARGIVKDMMNVVADWRNTFHECGVSERDIARFTTTFERNIPHEELSEEEDSGPSPF